MTRGFILQPTYRIEQGRPVVHIYGALEGGRSFLLRETREVPRFWVHREDAQRAAGLGATVKEEDPPRADMSGAAVSRVEIPTPPDAPPLRDRLIASGIPCFEADVRFAYRYLIDRGIRGSFRIDGEGVPGNGVDLVFEDAEVAPDDFAPALSVLSLDIETDPSASRILCIALAGCGASEVLFNTAHGGRAPAGSVPVAGEKELLETLVTRVRGIDPDVLTGWNVIGFDFSVIKKAADRAGVQLTLGRGAEPLRLSRHRYRASPRPLRLPPVVLAAVLRREPLEPGAEARDRGLVHDAPSLGPERPRSVRRLGRREGRLVAGLLEGRARRQRVALGREVEEVDDDPRARQVLADRAETADEEEVELGGGRTLLAETVEEAHLPVTSIRARAYPTRDGSASPPRSA